MGQSEGHHAYISCKSKTWGNMKQEAKGVFSKMAAYFYWGGRIYVMNLFV
jgi:hypothetical protein